MDWMQCNNAENFVLGTSHVRLITLRTTWALWVRHRYCNVLPFCTVLMADEVNATGSNEIIVHIQEACSVELGIDVGVSRIAPTLASSANKQM